MPDKIKIGLLAYDLSTLAGGTNLALTLGRELQKEGYEIAYACVYEDLNKLSKKFDIAPGFKIFKAKRPVLGEVMRTYNSLINHSFPVYKMCKEFKPDVVIETGGFLLSLAVPVLLKIPAIYYCMEPEREYSRGSLLNQLYFMPYNIIEKPILDRARTCAISAYTGKVIQNFSDSNITVIYPPVDTEVFAPGKEKENIILCVLRFRSVYKFEDLIDAFRKLNRRDYSLVIIGGLTKENEEYYDFLKGEIRNDGNITLFPNADFSQLLNYYKKSKFFWFHSGAYYGIVIAEAQSAGLPAISFGAESGPGEIIINGKTGYLVKNFDEMIERTKMLLSDEGLWKDMSIAARENAVSRLGTDVFRDKFREVIETIGGSI
jgi:glycosyltransferase involved in cell wall biosynthesis